MAALVLAGTTIPIALDGASEDAPELIGDRGRAFDGTMREVSDGYKRRWPLQTPLLASGDYNSIRAVLVATPPLAATGDITGSRDVFVELTGETMVKANGSLHRAIRFTLLEA